MKLFSLILLISFSVLAKPTTHLPPGINWHTVKVEKALELAKSEKKPLFLFWGAVWCPPCNYIKRNIFTTELFKKEAQNFISVYLDGDSKDAQFWGEKLKTLGYPTMLILNSEGQEIMRLPNGVSVNEYVSLMKQSRDNQFVMSERIKRAANDNATTSDWELLSGYSWDQDPSLGAFGLYLKAPEGQYKSKLYFSQLLSSEKPDLDPAYFEKIIQDETLVEINLMHFIDQSSKIFKTIYDVNNEAKVRAAKLFSKTLDKMFQNKKLVYYDQVGLYFPLITVDQIVEGKVTDEHLKQILKMAENASLKTKGVFERQSVMSLVLDILIEAKAFNQAKAIAIRELKISKSPFYFMSSLAAIAKAEGDEKASLLWAKKAWETSTGSNSRFQWGVSYLNKLFDDKNKKSEIKNEILNVIVVGLSNDESFVSRNKGRFEKLGKKISEWGSGQAASLIELKKTTIGLCHRNSMKAECLAWVNTL